MLTQSLINRVTNLPLEQRILLMEKTFKSIKKEIPKSNNLKNQALLMKEEYLSNQELTSFTTIDYLDFYEAR